MSILIQHHPAPAGPARDLLVMLPGAGITAADFCTHGLVQTAQAQNPGLDIIAAQPRLDLYLEDGVTTPLHERIIAPALARGSRIHLLGISLGGMGALLYASAHPQNIATILLLAPFLGTRGTTAELVRIGLQNWPDQKTIATAPEKRLLLWLQSHLQQPSPPALWLGYGDSDRFAPAHKILAAALPPGRVATTPGGHDWPSWTSLWQTLLARAPFTS